VKTRPRTEDCKLFPSASIAECRCIETNPTKSAKIKYKINLAVNCMCSIKGNCSSIAVEVEMQDIEGEQIDLFLSVDSNFTSNSYLNLYIQQHH